MPAPFRELFDTLSARLHAQWPAGERSRIKWPDRRFTEPTDGGSGGYYIAFFALDSEGTRISVSRVTPLHRWPGIIDIQIFTGREGGHHQIRDLADRIQTIFGGQSLLTASNYLVEVREVSLLRIGEREGWVQHNAWARFLYTAAF